MLLQRDQSSIHVLKPVIESLGCKLAGRIIQANILCKGFTIYRFELDDNIIYIHPASIFLGMTARYTLHRPFNDEKFFPGDHDKFFV